MGKLELDIPYDPGGANVGPITSEDLTRIITKIFIKEGIEPNPERVTMLHLERYPGYKTKYRIDAKSPSQWWIILPPDTEI